MVTLTIAFILSMLIPLVLMICIGTGFTVKVTQNEINCIREVRDGNKKGVDLDKDALIYQCISFSQEIQECFSKGISEGIFGNTNLALKCIPNLPVGAGEIYLKDDDLEKKADAIVQPCNDIYLSLTEVQKEKVRLHNRKFMNAMRNDSSDLQLAQKFGLPMNLVECRREVFKINQLKGENEMKTGTLYKSIDESQKRALEKLDVYTQA